MCFSDVFFYVCFGVCVDFEMRKVAGKGVGMFALRDFKRGDKIFTERPLITHDLFSNEVPEPSRWAVDALMPLNGSLRAKLKLNSIRVQRMVPPYKLFVMLARMNHSCLGNTHYEDIPTRGAAMLIALCDIKAGDELTRWYIDPLMPVALRRETLRHLYGFACDCAVCTNSTTRSQLDHMKLLFDSLNGVQHVSEIDRALKLGTELVPWLEKFNFPFWYLARAYFVMFCMAGMSRDLIDAANKFLHLSEKFASLQWDGVKDHSVFSQILDSRRKFNENPRFLL